VAEGPKKRKGLLGCSFPVTIGVIVFFTVLGVVSLVAGALGRKLFTGINVPSWLVVEQPHPQLPPETIFHLFGIPVSNTMITSWIAILVVALICYLGTRKMRLVPGRFQAMIEAIIGYLLTFCQDIAGEENGRKFFPVIATIFLYVIANAWLSLIPGVGSLFITNAEGEVVHLFRGANTDINLPLALALISFVFVEYWGIKENGFSRYMGKFINTSRIRASIRNISSGKAREGASGLFNGFIDMFIGALEGLSELVRIISFTFRLFGNMTGGEILLLMMIFLAPFLLAIPFYGLELLVGFIQALIFAGLTLVFAVIAIAPPHAEE
jgi:F-type H+-transporting ATPase subunit a